MRMITSKTSMHCQIVFLILFFQANSFIARGQLITEIYETCTAIEGERARCGPNANCFIINGVPTCHCIVDTLSGVSTAGNPYKACTWDISGTWQLFSYIDKTTGFKKEILNPTSNQPFVIRLDRTDALLKTRYLLGAIFMITAMTAFSVGFCGKAFLDANDNTSVLMEQAEGFLDQNGRSILLRTPMLDTTLIKLSKKFADRYDLKGKWQKSDGSKVEMSPMKKPLNWPNSRSPSFTKRFWSYWYDDSAYGSPAVRSSMGLFIDSTLKEEKIAFNSDSQFIQVGWYGSLRFGSNTINIYSPKHGKPIYTLLRIDTFQPLAMPGPMFHTSYTTIQEPNAPTNTSEVLETIYNISDMLFPSSLNISSIFGIPLDGTLENFEFEEWQNYDALSVASNILSGLPGFLTS